MNELIEKAVKAVKNGQKCAFVTIIEASGKGTPRKAGAKMVVLEDGSLFGSIGGGGYEKEAQKEALRAIRRNKTKLLTYDYTSQKGYACGGQIKVFVEPFLPSRRLICCGAGHIALPLSVMAKMAGFKVTILDNRQDLANNKRFPHVDHIVCGPFAGKLSRMDTTSNTAVMVATYGHEHDLECLKIAARSSAGYVGVMASLQKRKVFFKALRALKVPQSTLKKISMPAGLDIGAQTPQEIAVSIMAEIISRNNHEFKGSAKFTSKN